MGIKMIDDSGQRPHLAVTSTPRHIITPTQNKRYAGRITVCWTAIVEKGQTGGESMIDRHTDHAQERKESD